MLNGKFVPLLCFVGILFQGVFSLVLFKFGRAYRCGTSMRLLFLPSRHVL